MLCLDKLTGWRTHGAVCHVCEEERGHRNQLSAPPSANSRIVVLEEREELFVSESSLLEDASENGWRDVTRVNRNRDASVGAAGVNQTGVAAGLVMHTKTGTFESMDHLPGFDDWQSWRHAGKYEGSRRENSSKALYKLL